MISNNASYDMVRLNTTNKPQDHSNYFITLELISKRIENTSLSAKNIKSYKKVRQK
jgi:hypothetical protein